MLRVKKRAPNARAARGSGGMLPLEILKIVVLYNDYYTILVDYLRPCHTRQFVLATCDAIFAVKNIAGCS